MVFKGTSFEKRGDRLNFLKYHLMVNKTVAIENLGFPLFSYRSASPERTLKKAGLFLKNNIFSGECGICRRDGYNDIYYHS
jgi:hypothetical protein